MKNSYRFAIVVTLAVCTLAASVAGYGQALPTDPVERAKVVAQFFEANARRLTLFDREGKEAGVVGQRDVYNQPVFSPDLTRVAVSRIDLDKERSDLWVLDIATGRGTQITASQTREQATNPAWSPDGSQVVYVGVRGGYFGIYRKASNGEGREELLYQGGSLISLNEWSMDGRYLSYFSADLAGGNSMFALPLNATGERKPIEIARSKTQIQGGRFSPDSRFIAYASNESGKMEIYVRPFDPAAAPGSKPAAGPWQISDQGGLGMANWRRDGKELYYLAADRGIMAVPVTTSPDFEFGKPTLLFRPPADAITGVTQWNCGYRGGACAGGVEVDRDCLRGRRPQRQGRPVPVPDRAKAALGGAAVKVVEDARNLQAGRVEQVAAGVEGRHRHLPLQQLRGLAYGVIG